MKVVLVSGKARHGKDTVAQLLYEELQFSGCKVLITHFADVLKYVCKNFLGWNGKKDEYGRQLLQYIGTDVVRKKYPSLWADFIAIILDCFSDEWDCVIIPDCRFPNEISTISEKGFETYHIRVVRPGFEDELTSEQRSHISETALDEEIPDEYINNGGTLDDLKHSVSKFVKEKLYG